MKHVLSILLALVSLVSVAQEATVKSVVTDPMNISASKYPMTDLNGRTAPLVIVRVLADNVEFKGSVLDGGVQKKTGEYWVYMGAGAKMLHIHSDRFLPVEINFPDYDIPRLEPSTTYIVTLTLPQPAAQPQSAAAKGTGEFSTTPVHMALCATGPDGQDAYITAKEWKALPASSRSLYTAKGVCFSLNGEIFLVGLHDEEGGKVMDWEQAMRYNLPTKRQGETIVKNKRALNKALRAFGGTDMYSNVNGWYWTGTEDEPYSAWYIDLFLGSVNSNGKTLECRARSIVSVPESSAR